MENGAEQRRNGRRLKDDRARSMREAVMGAKETEFPYVHVPVPVAVVDLAASPADFLVWVAMRAHLGPEKISTSAATIAKETGLTREGVASSMKRLVSSGLLIPTGTTGRKGTKVYTVPEHLAGSYRAGKSLPVVPMAAAA
jgi:CRP-like cAMP-binding protein